MHKYTAFSDVMYQANKVPVSGRIPDIVKGRIRDRYQIRTDYAAGYLVQPQNPNYDEHVLGGDGCTSPARPAGPELESGPRDSGSAAGQTGKLN